jgi:hypothetical protein
VTKPFHKSRKAVTSLGDCHGARESARREVLVAS